MTKSITYYARSYSDKYARMYEYYECVLGVLVLASRLASCPLTLAQKPLSDTSASSSLSGCLGNCVLPAPGITILYNIVSMSRPAHDLHY